MEPSDEATGLPGDDTIAAIITPPGAGGIAAVRIAGRRSRSILERLFQPKSNQETRPFLMRCGQLVSGLGEPIDEVLAVWMPLGQSYTGLEQVELFCHGGRQVVRRVLDEILVCGARAAEPGEFTRIAFLNGRIDLARAEAVAEVIAADTDLSYRVSREHLLGAYSNQIENLRYSLIAILADLEASIDFTEEEIESDERAAQIERLENIARELGELISTYRGGEIIREGFKLAIGGRPNAGKSSLFNLLLKRERALVNPKAGTTRDYLSEWIDIEGLAVNLIDTAGIRRGGGEIEKLGQQSARKLLADADLILWMVDLSSNSWKRNLKAELRSLGDKPNILLGNKIDIVEKHDRDERINLEISCKTGRGFKQLHEMLHERIAETLPDLTSGLVVTSARHESKLKACLDQVQTAKALIDAEESPELPALELRLGIQALEEITGRIYNEEVLGAIFSRFCIGK